MQKHLAGSYFAAFSTNRITVGLQHPKNLPSPSHFFAVILQVRPVASRLYETCRGSGDLSIGCNADSERHGPALIKSHPAAA